MEVKIAVFLPNWVGDAVMATPALRMIRNSCPNAQVTGIMRPSIAETLRGGGWLDDVLLFARRASGELGDTRRLIATLRQRRLDQLLLMTNSLSTAWIGWRTAARQRIGFARQGRGWLLTHRLRAPRESGRLVPRSAVEHYLEIAWAAGGSGSDRQLELATTSEDEAAADRVWEKFQLDRGGPVVLMNTGAAFGPAKAWPNEHFAELARRVCEFSGGSVLFLCGPSEREAVATIVQQARHPRVHSLADEPIGIGLSKACVRRGDLMVSTDSGPRHFAAAFQVPLITLFGPTDPRWSDNYHRQAVDLQLSLDCRPCARRTCPLGHHRCLRDLAPQHVLHHVQRFLDRQAGQLECRTATALQAC